MQLDLFFDNRRTNITADRAGFAESLQKAEDAGVKPIPRLWFDYLRFAEYLRCCQRDDNELVRVRRKLRTLQPDMFTRYMEKIKGSSKPP